MDKEAGTLREMEQLRLANEELAAFNHLVAHALRNPLQNITGFSRFLLENHPVTPAVTSALQEINLSAIKMTQLINTLVTFSQSQHAEIKSSKVNLSLVCNAIFAHLNKEFPNHNVAFSVQDNLIITGDLCLLEVAFDNLLRNAWKYTSKTAGANIAVGMREDGILYVQDNGIGFSEDQLDKLFTPFVRLHSAKEFPGTGLGLATVKSIINRHGGRIWAEKNVDKKGATFCIFLP